jgi:hypothetical protein
MRSTVTLVKTIMSTGLEDVEIEALIEVANRMVTSVLPTSSLSEAVLTDIETWLTAHLIAIGKERQTKDERVGDVWVKYNESKGQFLLSTTYGQMVLFLDSTGSFQSSSKLRASITAIKQEPE